MTPTKYNAMILEVAHSFMGLKEFPGAQHNPEIVEMFKEAGHGWVQDDETPWCAAFIGSVLAQIGLQGTGELNARSYLTWGEKVPLNKSQPGDICVFWRGSPSGWQGHVAILVKYERDSLLVRGGNQGNKVSDQWYPVTKLLDVRRAVIEGSKTQMRPVLRRGDKGVFVTDLQTQLAELKYHLGEIDGHFGPMTETSVLSFQSDNDLTTDGVVGRVTWDALGKARPRSLGSSRSETTVDDLRKKGSRTIKDADGAGKAAAGGLLATLAGWATTLLDGAGAAQGRVQSLLSDIPDWLFFVAMALAMVAVLYYLKKVKDHRVDDARSGRNTGR